MVKLVVEIECFGMSFDEFDKETVSSDGLQPKQADLSCVHALNEPHLHEIHVVPSKHEADQRGKCFKKHVFTLKIFSQLHIVASDSPEVIDKKAYMVNLGFSANPNWFIATAAGDEQADLLKQGDSNTGSDMVKGTKKKQQQVMRVCR
ncbi:hypothetical protein Tco_0537476 [Tanacetum coccineum]